MHAIIIYNIATNRIYYRHE